MTAVRVLLLSGSTRTGSTNSAALRVLADSRPDGVEPVLLDLLRELPAFDPDVDPPPPVVQRLRAEVGRADLVLVSTPEYAGALPGAFKNLLDHLVGGPEAGGTPVAWLDVAAPGRGAGARAELETVVGYLGMPLLEGESVHVPRSALDEEGRLTDAAVVAELRGALSHLVGRLSQIV